MPLALPSKRCKAAILQPPFSNTEKKENTENTERSKRYKAAIVACYSAVFFSHNKSMNSTFSHGFSAKRTGHSAVFFSHKSSTTRF